MTRVERKMQELKQAIIDECGEAVDVQIFISRAPRKSKAQVYSLQAAS